ncbi:helix-turn-helix transcriptional regulator [Streptomyces sp. RerS4]|uniref:helix-turn-helix domain-containing protein n=1 Tax=Streptomyces sp. RerS4 TaxID=2942449 RepID=UPI00201C9200|nr:helix-turn-helix transcriptional regulator [Streptomyces sp. RerS4]UQX01818.1 helix-turn-helix transcriptional regulator [Streptomyces sp. RerS4]
MAKSSNKRQASGVTRLVAHLARVLRERAGLTQRELGVILGYSGAAISALETCAQPASDEMLVKLEGKIGNGLGAFDFARELVRVDTFAPHFQDFFSLEQEALTLCLFETRVIYGIFQTEDYARALFEGGYPVLSEQRVQELIEGRMARKALFDRDPTALVEFVVDEGALRRGIGSKAIMRAQFRYLAELAQRRSVTVQVLPLDCGFSGEHAGTSGAMSLVETPRHERLLYMEQQDESMLISDPGKVSLYAQRYAKIRAQALDPRESLGFIERLAGE